MTERAGHATEIARAGLAEGVDTVVAVGGDGTLNEVGRALAGSDVPVGIIPAGSGNALARCLGIPLDPAEACGVLLDGAERAIDVGSFGDEMFLSTAGIGLDAEVCWRFNEVASRRGLLTYLSEAVKAVFGYEPCPVRLFLDEGDVIEASPSLLTVANTPAFGYGAMIAPGAEPDDGVLDVCIVEDLTVLRAALNAHRLFNGTFDRTHGVSRYRAKHIRIKRETPGRIQVDGESREGAATLDVSVVKGGLRVVVPA